MTTDNTELSQKLLILVDEEDNIVGYEKKEKCHQGEGLLHRAFSILIFNDDKQLLIQKRGSEKVLWPLYWSNSVCSHPRVGESYEEAAVRRLEEELGFETRLQLLYKFQYQEGYKDIGSENEMCSVYIGKANGIVKPNRSEIAEWTYVDLKNLEADMLTRPHLYTPWFKMELERIHRYHRIEVDNL